MTDLNSSEESRVFRVRDFGCVLKLMGNINTHVIREPIRDKPMDTGFYEMQTLNRLKTKYGKETLIKMVVL